MLSAEKLLCTECCMPTKQIVYSILK
uniref:Uncharacterized protein n=1 Tax=Anguilla anguilla TaxID=7936 RepID=A0A0E9TXV1_ANGAN